MANEKNCLGLYLAAEPTGGGTYQYSISIADGLAGLADRGWSLTAITHDESWAEQLSSDWNVVVEPIDAKRRTIGRLYRQIDRFSAGIRRSARFDLARSILRNRFDILVFPGQELVGAQVSSPAIVAVHDLMHRYESGFSEYSRIVSAGRERRYRAITSTAAGILVDSDLGKTQIIESYGVDPESVHVLPFVVPPYLMSPVEVDIATKYSLDYEYLFYPAQLWEHKNHIRLLEAIALNKRRGLEINLVLAGSPQNADQQVRSRIQNLDLTSNVRLLGYVPNEDMYSLYMGAHATVFVSLIGPTSIPPLEAMYLGSPLVAGRRYAMEEQVGDAAILVDPLDVQSIADGIARIWTDPELRAKLTARGHARSASWTRAEFGERLCEIVTHMSNKELKH